MFKLVLFALLGVSSIFGAIVPEEKKEEPWAVRLYTMPGGSGAYYDINDFTYDLESSGFNNIVKSVCGHGLWLLYENAEYASGTLFNSAWTQVFAHYDDTCIDLPQPRQAQLSSLRYSGSGSFDDEILTLYMGRDFTGGEDMLIRSDDNLGEFSNQATSLVITGASPWTVYRDAWYGGVAMCLEPLAIVGADGILYYGAWNVADLGIDNNQISSIQKGCHSSKVIKMGEKQ